MDTACYTYESLAKKYGNFLGPSCEIQINGRTIHGQNKFVPEVEVELTADGTASGCTFSIDGQYDLHGTQWKDDLENVVKVGAKLIVKGGYVKKKEIFYGCIDEYSYDFSTEAAPRIRITAVDGLAFLMSQREPQYGGKKKAAEIVREILQKSVAAGYAKSVKVGTLSPDFEVPIVKEQIDDWKFLNMMAQRHGASLLAVDGEMIFDTVASQTSPILTFSQNCNLHSFSKRVSMAHQVGFVEIWGRDVNQIAVKGTADTVTAGGSGSSPADIVSALKNAGLREYSEFARTENECKILAQNRLNGIAMGFVTGEAACIGIPELIAGRYVKIDSGDKTMNGTYFMTKVCHRFTLDSYTTSFVFKGAKV